MKKGFFVFLAVIFCFVQSGFSQEMPSPTASKGYLLGPGDEVKIKVLGEPQFDFEGAVNELGQIEIPFYDEPIPAMCKSERDVKADVTKALSKYLRSPQVTFQVTARKSRPPVVVYGEVRNAQNVVMMREARLLELLSFAGGLTEDAGGMIQLFRPQAPICGSAKDIADWQAEAVDGFASRFYSMSSVKAGGEGNPIVYPGDIILVQKAAPIYITGEVRNPQGLRLQESGLSLSQAMAMVGGVSREAKTKEIKIYRLKPNSKDRTIIAANYDLIKKGEQKDVMLEPNDIIEVDKAKKSIGETIFELATGTARTAIGGFGGMLPQRVLY